MFKSFGIGFSKIKEKRGGMDKSGKVGVECNGACTADDKEMCRSVQDGIGCAQDRILLIEKNIYGQGQQCLIKDVTNMQFPKGTVPYEKRGTSDSGAYPIASNTEDAIRFDSNINHPHSGVRCSDTGVFCTDSRPICICEHLRGRVRSLKDFYEDLAKEESKKKCHCGINSSGNCPNSTVVKAENRICNAPNCTTTCGTATHNENTDHHMNHNSTQNSTNTISIENECSISGYTDNTKEPHTTTKEQDHNDNESKTPPMYITPHEQDPLKEQELNKQDPLKEQELKEQDPFNKQEKNLTLKKNEDTQTLTKKAPIPPIKLEKQVKTLTKNEIDSLKLFYQEKTLSTVKNILEEYKLDPTVRQIVEILNSKGYFIQNKQATERKTEKK